MAWKNLCVFLFNDFIFVRRLYYTTDSALYIVRGDMLEKHMYFFLAWGFSGLLTASSWSIDTPFHVFHPTSNKYEY